MATVSKVKYNDKPSALFNQVQEFAAQYHALGHDDPAGFDFMTVFTVGTWAFSPGSPATPYTYPYAYVTGTFGSGKSVLGRDVFGSLCNNPEKITQVTGPALFRLMADEDEETGEIINRFPTLLIDEIDATFYGAANEPLRGGLNEGYTDGATIPRVKGRTTVRFPVFGPKVLIGASNGKLPESVTQRCIRVDCVKHSQAELDALGVLPMFPWETAEPIGEIRQACHDWITDNGMILRDYNPPPMEGLTARQWQIARSIVQIARALGVEGRIRRALVELFNRQPKVVDRRVELYTAIFEVFEDNDTTKVTTKMVLAHLRERGIGIPGGSGKGLASVLSEDGIQPTYLRIDKPDHPAFVEGKPTHRGYHRYQFDQAFVNFLPEDDEDDE